MFMKKVLSILLCLVVVLSLAACSGNKPVAEKLKVGDMLDTDTEEVYSLGDPRARFDEDFGQMGIDGDGDEVEYLQGLLTVTFKEDKAVSIECDGASDRFAFYGFTFDTELNRIEGRYERFDTSGYVFYTRYYNPDGSETPITPDAVEHQLMVRSGDLLDMKDGQYLSYEISLLSA